MSAFSASRWSTLSSSSASEILLRCAAKRLRQAGSELGSSFFSASFFETETLVGASPPSDLSDGVEASEGAGTSAGLVATSSSVKTFLGLGAIFFCSRALRAASATGSPVLDWSCWASATEGVKDKPSTNRHAANEVIVRMVLPPGRNWRPQYFRW